MVEEEKIAKRSLMKFLGTLISEDVYFPPDYLRGAEKVCVIQPKCPDSPFPIRWCLSLPAACVGVSCIWSHKTTHRPCQGGHGGRVSCPEDPHSEGYDAVLPHSFTHAPPPEMHFLSSHLRCQRRVGTISTPIPVSIRVCACVCSVV